jgi:hypothetical protein
VRGFVQSLIALVVLLGALGVAYWAFLVRPPGKQLETAVRGQATATVAAGQAGATLDAERIVTRTIERERIIHEVTDHARQTVQAAPDADTPLPADFVRAVNDGLHDIDAGAVGGRGVPVR